jgi:hypothetical protein
MIKTGCMQKLNYRQTPVSVVYHGLKKIWKIREINSSLVSKRAPSENGP